ncbi:hypothetical protein EV586_103458 [Tumebacillus sp. BK434]|nr:hypothetical protein EV586_103458 [Tumebacillus sp. BK434]
MVLVTDSPQMHLVRWAAEVREKAVGLPWETGAATEGFGAFSVGLNEAETGWLLEQQAAEEVLLTAFCTVLSDWTGRSAQWVKVGTLPLLIELSAEENPVAVLNHVRKQVQRVREHDELRELAGMEAVLAKYAVPRPEAKLHVGDGALTAPHRYPLELRAEWIGEQLFVRLHFAKRSLCESTASWLTDRFTAELQRMIQG